MATPTTLPATFVAGNVLTAAQMNDLRGAFRVLQVVQAVKTDTFTTTSTSYVDVTGMSVAITPSATSSKVLIICQASFAVTDTHEAFLQLAGGNSGTFIGDAAGSRSRCVVGGGYGNLGNLQLSHTITYLDSPATTSATTYKLQARVSAGTFSFNRTFSDADSGDSPRGASSITVMEISA